MAMRANSTALQDPRQNTVPILPQLKQVIRRPTRCALLIVIGFLQLNGFTFTGARLAGTSARSCRRSPLNERGGLLKLRAREKARLEGLYHDAMQKIKAGDRQDGFRQLMEVADEGCPPAMRDLGIMYSYGKMGLTKDIEQGLQWSTKAADAGDVSANYNLACTYLAGMNGAPVIKHEAAKRFRLAAEGGFAPAMSNLATMLIKGDGIPRDMQLGAHWLVRAAEKTGNLESLLEKVSQGNLDPETAQAVEENVIKLRMSAKDNPYDKVNQGKVIYWNDEDK